MAYRKVVWSPVEVEYLSRNKNKPIGQLCIALAKTKSAINKKLMELTGKKKQAPVTCGKRSKIGKRKDCDNQFFRSSWEANCYRVFKRDKNIALVEYEPTTFSFAPHGILKGTVSYTPDFKITYNDGTVEWVEVKGGWMRPSDKTRLRRFKKFYPEEYARLCAITPGPTSKTTLFFQEMEIPIKWHYPVLSKQFKDTIPGWEK